ncbi:MAG TPA: GAF domain-containing sensor histidine kinase, partial [Acidothermaceae bacterium]|nr:GAF domain-containing sensor histidine kinase [Acidothermaceae bacterium]
MTGALRDFLRQAGEVGRDLASVDWAATPLGEPESWPRSLETIVRAMLTSRFSMWMAWGPELTFFCNDAYRRDTLGKKYPWALGRPFPEVWSEVWPNLRPRIENVLTSGEATWDERLLLFLERSGYVEETYHTFSYSPLTDDSDAIAGILCVVSEETERVLAARRMDTLRDLAAELTTVRDEPTLFATVAGQLDRNQLSLPFTLTYLLDDEGFSRLASASGISPGHPAAPLIIDPGQADPPWPVDDVASGVAVLIGDLAERFTDLPTGAWTQPPTSAYVTPLTQQGPGRPYGFFVAALNRYREFDDNYRGFVDLLAGQLSSSIASARVYEAERQRAEQLAELDRAKTAFFTNVSHEFRTPLTLILGPTEDMLSDGSLPDDGPLRDRIALINRNAQRLLKLVNTLLDFSSLESGSERGNFEATDLAELTADLAETFRPAIVRAGLELRTEIEPLPGVVHVDREMWAKIVLNL